MRFLLAALTALLLNGAAAEEPPRKAALTIMISTAGDHLRAHFHSDRPIDEIVLDDRQSPENHAPLWAVQMRQWRFLEPGWIPCKGFLARTDGATFQDVDLDLYPDDVPVGYASPLVFPAGGGFVLSSRYLLGNPRRFETTVIYKPREGEMLDIGASGPANPIQRDFTRAVYFGPASALTAEAGVRLVVDPAFPADARRSIVAEVRRSLAFYRERVGLELPWEPTLIMAALPPALDTSHTGIVGNAFAGGVATFRFYGPGSLSGAEADRAALERVPAHEVFHFWDAYVGRALDGGRSPWIHEGGAEYAALLARRAAGQLGDKAFYRELDRTLLACRRQLGTQGLDDLPPLERYRQSYPCGMIIHWIADMAIQHASHQQNGIFDLWRDLLLKAKGQGGFYGADDFRDVLRARDPAALTAIDGLLKPDTGNRWAKLRAQLESYGVKTAPALQSETEARLALFRQLVDLDCAKAGSWQLSEGLDGFRLYLGTRGCRHFGPNTEVRAVEGFSLFSEAYAAHSAAMSKCAAGATVDLTLTDTRSIGIVCARPMAPLAYSPPDFVVRGLP